MDESWFLEKHTPHAGLTLAIKSRLHDVKTPFQRLEVLDTYEYGRMLLLDGYVMLTDRDEFIYHEMIVHPALLCHPAPRRVCIIGGGDGGSVREVLRHSSVESVRLVEIDGSVIDACKTWFPAVSRMLDDPRVEIIVGDGFDHLQHHADAYDVILVDSIDPMGESTKLFSGPFYGHAAAALRPGGVFVCQSESPFYNCEVPRKVLGHLRGLHAHAAAYLAAIPTYPSGLWSFCFASGTVNPLTTAPRTDADVLSQLRYFSPEVFRAALTLPPYMAAELTAGSAP